MILLTRGLFPNAEKAAYISQIYKSGDKAAIDNYRRISVLSIDIVRLDC